MPAKTHADRRASGQPLTGSGHGTLLLHQDHSPTSGPQMNKREQMADYAGLLGCREDTAWGQ